jgi:acetaldehyde dehydrogenase
MAGIIPESKGLALARQEGVAASAKGIAAILKNRDIEIVFDSTHAHAHVQHAPLLSQAGIIAIDLTPAAVGPHVIPVINLDQNLNAMNLNLITCGGQATIPIVRAISQVAETPYAEIVATIASKSAGPGTRQNIDEFTETTAQGIVTIGGAKRGMAIILLNPAEPPMIMNNTVYARVAQADQKAIKESILDMVARIQAYVPGYRLKIPPIFDGDKVTVMIEVEGAGDYLPVYSGNLDIMTCAALSVGDRIAEYRLFTSSQKTGGENSL